MKRQAGKYEERWRDKQGNHQMCKSVNVLKRKKREIKQDKGNERRKGHSN